MISWPEARVVRKSNVEERRTLAWPDCDFVLSSISYFFFTPAFRFNRRVGRRSSVGEG